MFIIEKIFVDDKQLPKVLYAIAGLIIKMDPPRPVINAVAKNGEVKQASSAVSIKGQLVEKLAHLKGQQLGIKEIRTMFISLGGQPKSVNHALLQQLLEQKVIKRKSRGVYAVV